MVTAGLAAVVTLLALGVTATTGRSTLLDVRQVSYAGDTWSNYDLLTQGTSNADWPVDVIFWGNASISKIYNKLGWFFPGSNSYAQLDDGTATGLLWVASSGRKNSICTDTHVRLYADADGYLTANSNLGNYVIATTHLDKNECSRTPSYGFNEAAEANLAARAAAVWGSAAVVPNATTLPDGTPTSTLLTNEIHRIDGSRNYDNNGLPTLIKVP
jgi:hypothetical protein